MGRIQLTPLFPQRMDLDQVKVLNIFLQKAEIGSRVALPPCSTVADQKVPLDVWVKIQSCREAPQDLKKSLQLRLWASHTWPPFCDELTGLNGRHICNL